MSFGISDKDQTQVKEAFSSLWKVCGNAWSNLVDDKSEEKIKELEEQIWNLEEQIQQLTEKQRRNLK